MHLLYLNYDALIRSLCDDYDDDDDVRVRAQCNTLSRKSIKRSSPIILLRRVLLSIKSRYAFYLQWSVLYLRWYFFHSQYKLQFILSNWSAFNCSFKRYLRGLHLQTTMKKPHQYSHKTHLFDNLTKFIPQQ